MSFGTKLLERYRAYPSGSTSIFAAVTAFSFATIGRFLSAVAATYFCDRSESKGDDLTIGLGGLFAGLTFVTLHFSLLVSA